MMENYREARITKDIDEKGVIPEEQCFECVSSTERNKQNLDFGAEAVNINKDMIANDAIKTKMGMCATNENNPKITVDASGDQSNAANGENEESDDEDDDYENEHKRLYGSSDDSETSDSDYSDLSGLSDISGREWKPISARPINWVQRQIHSGANPRELLSQFLPNNDAHQLAPDLNDMALWRILASMLCEPPRREKLRYVNTFEHIIQLVLESQNVIVLTGAGVSVSCGIPDFRSSDGIYSRLAKDFPDLPDPQAMFDINYFSRDPRPFYKFAREIYPGQFKPSPCHRFIKMLEDKQKLLRNYTQNIDTLEQVAGIKNVIECHGSFSTASCTKCRFKCTADAIRPDIFAQRIPVCPRCQPNVHQSVDASEPVSEMDLKLLVQNGIMKPDIVFFGEGLPEEFHKVMASDKDKCDLLIVMGSSLKVRPVALIPSSIPANVPQILINREQLHHLEFDVELLGDSDVIINQLCHRLNDDWRDICFDNEKLIESKELLPQYVEEEEEEEEADATEDSEAEAQQLHDTDTQSIKSNGSTDIVLRSAGNSDSGFESSTSSGVVVEKALAAAAAKCITPGQSLQPVAKNKTIDLLLPPDLHEEPMDAIVDIGHHNNFHGFAERLGQEKKTAFAENTTRHMSIDSSKDSGIQCDATSNSALSSVSSAGTLLLPPVNANFNEKADTNSEAKNHANIHLTKKLTTPTEAAKINNVQRQNCVKQSFSTSKFLSAAERLHEGTYYYHESTSSYVFPGAQVAWCSDDEEDEEISHDFVNEIAAITTTTTDDTNETTLSPLLPPSVEAEMVCDISSATTSTTITAINTNTKTTTTATTLEHTILTSSNTSSSSGVKRAVDETLLRTEIDCSTNQSNKLNAVCPPPLKRLCGNEAQSPTEAFACIQHKTKDQAVSTDTLLQQL